MAERPCRAVAFALAVCAGHCASELPRAIDSIAVPAVLRVGSPLEVRGRGLAGARLRLTDAPVDVTWTTVSAGADGLEVATACLPESPHWRAGQRFGGACLVSGQWPGWQACAAIDSRFRSDWTAGAVQWQPASLAWGATIAVHAEDLLLPGEGALWAEIEDTQAIRTAPLRTALPTGRAIGQLAVGPAWTGVQPGGRQLRLRLAGLHRGHASAGPWTAWQPATLAEPQVAALGQPLVRGAAVPLAIKAVGDQASLGFAGIWRSTTGQVIAAWNPGPKLDFSGLFAVLGSSWHASHLAGMVSQGAVRFEGTVALQVAAGGQQWAGKPVAVDWLLRPVQRVELVAGPGLNAALHRLGLASLASPLRTAIIDRLRKLFSPYAVQIAWSPPDPPVGEWLRLHLQDRDPNGLGLLGAEGGVTKDVGNLVLDEQLGGLNPSALQAGHAAYGGVFVGELLGFSKALHPASTVADPAFDAVFGPWCPLLGGKVAHASDLDKARPAIAVLAQVVAEVAAHEIGHALGLPADTDAAHHGGDHPGWIMDAGTARPFGERAGLTAGPASQWGPVDAAYLAAVLPP